MEKLSLRNQEGIKVLFSVAYQEVIQWRRICLSQSFALGGCVLFKKADYSESFASSACHVLLDPVDSILFIFD